MGQKPTSQVAYAACPAVKGQKIWHTPDRCSTWSRSHGSRQPQHLYEHPTSSARQSSWPDPSSAQWTPSFIQQRASAFWQAPATHSLSFISKWKSRSVYPEMQFLKRNSDYSQRASFSMETALIVSLGSYQLDGVHLLCMPFPICARLLTMIQVLMHLFHQSQQHVSSAHLCDQLMSVASKGFDLFLDLISQLLGPLHDHKRYTFLIIASIFLAGGNGTAYNMLLSKKAATPPCVGTTLSLVVCTEEYTFQPICSAFCQVSSSQGYQPEHSSQGHTEPLTALLPWSSR